MEINEFLNKLILAARQEPIKNSPEAKEFKELFTKPCQITGIWFRNDDKVNIQAFYITHNIQKKDLETYIIGPFQMNSTKKYNPFEKYFTKGELFRYNDSQNDSEHIKKDFIDVLRKLDINYFFSNKHRENKRFTFNYGRLVNNTFFMTSIKKLQDRKITSPISKFKKIIKIKEKHREWKNPPIESDIEYYVGWQIDLDMWIGPELRYDFNDRVEGKKIKKCIQCEIDTTYRNQKLEIDSDGYCRLYFGEKKPESSQLKQIIKNVNDFLAIFLINDYDLPQIHNNDLILWKNSKKKYPPTNNPAQLRPFNFINHSSLPEDVKDFRAEYCDEVDFSKHDFFSREKILEMIKVANSINKHPKLYEMIHILQESYTYFDEKRYNASFIMSWALLEQLICQKWKDELKKLKKSHIDFSGEKKIFISEKIHDLASWKRISKEQEKVLKKIAQSRNKFLHELKPVNRDFADGTLRGALIGIQSEVKKKFPLKEVN